ncbi:RHS repeat-associated core domain-containing protein [Bryobacter aggregatus]|uniref:RHS repeat-associated core domain-containing protein n=1 Tax=Bryobacter aggregatus TaxID=360054 RepID=UPI0004E0D6D1|nr:RHS repeat-associated core domain-containing protein [Bryobacter aggregatus]
MAAVIQAAKATAQLFVLAAVCLPVFANIPRSSLVAEKPHLGVANFALVSHRADSAANVLIAPGLPGCLYDSSARPCCSGKERDAETGLDFFGARYMSSAMGRFTSPDVPLLDQQPGDPQSWNLYSYVRNNPLIFTDPTGNDCVYVNSGGNGVDSINNQNTSQDCGKTGGYWVDGTVTQARFAHGSLILTGTTDGANRTSASYGLGSDPGLMALQRAGQIASPVTEPKNIAAFYIASAAVGYGGMQLAGRLGYAELQSLGRIIPEIAPTPGHLGAVSRTAAQGGRKAVEKFLRGQLKALAEHEEKLVRYRAEGGYTSQVEGTIRNVKGLIKAATDWLSKNP